MKSHFLLKTNLILGILITVIFAGPKKEFEIAIQENTIESYQTFIKKRAGNKLVDSAIILLENAYYYWTISENDINAYTIYLEKYPDGKYKSKVLNEIESLYFKQVKEKNTLEAFYSYLNKYQNGKFKKAVLNSIEYLTFKQANSINTKESYSSYLKKYPNSKYFKKVYDKLELFFYEEAVASRNIQNYKNYLLQYPNGKFKKNARDSIMELPYIHTVNKHNIGSYREYLSKYPNSKYTSIIKNRIDSISTNLTWDRFVREESYDNCIKFYNNNKEMLPGFRITSGNYSNNGKFSAFATSQDTGVIVKHGIIRWWENNQLRKEERYYFDRLIGEYREWDSKGNIILLENYDSLGRAQGVWKEWSGKLLLNEVTYKNGLKNGFSSSYYVEGNKKGKIKEKFLYKNDEIIEDIVLLGMNIQKKTNNSKPGLLIVKNLGTLYGREVKNYGRQWNFNVKFSEKNGTSLIIHGCSTRIYDAYGNTWGNNDTYGEYEDIDEIKVSGFGSNRYSSWVRDSNGETDWTDANIELEFICLDVFGNSFTVKTDGILK